VYSPLYTQIVQRLEDEALMIVSVRLVKVPGEIYTSCVNMLASHYASMS